MSHHKRLIINCLAEEKDLVLYCKDGMIRVNPEFFLHGLIKLVGLPCDPTLITKPICIDFSEIIWKIYYKTGMQLFIVTSDEIFPEKLVGFSNINNIAQNTGIISIDNAIQSQKYYCSLYYNIFNTIRLFIDILQSKQMYESDLSQYFENIVECIRKKEGFAYVDHSIFMKNYQYLKPYLSSLHTYNVCPI